MKRLRINLHVREDVSPALYRALAPMAPKPRAERLRAIAEVGLQLEPRTAGPGSGSGERGSQVVAELPPMEDEESIAAAFGADLERLIGHAR